MPYQEIKNIKKSRQDDATKFLARDLSQSRPLFLGFKNQTITIMGQSLVQNYIHLVFHTKNSQQLIFPDKEDKLYGYINGICENLKSPALAVGGHLNHIHILCRVNRSIAVSTLAQKIKANSSRWYKSQDERLKYFSWQDGFGGFSVSTSHLHNLIRYIENQHKHHNTISFDEEYISLLKEYNLDYDEKYLW